MDQLAQTTPYLDFLNKKSSTQDFIRKTLEKDQGAMRAFVWILARNVSAAPIL